MVPPRARVGEPVIPEACSISSATEAARPGTMSIRQISSAIPLTAARCAVVAPTPPAPMNPSRAKRVGSQAARPVGGDPARSPAIEAAADGPARVRADRRRALQRPADDLQPESLHRVERLRGDDVVVGHHHLAPSATEGVANVLLADDAHSRPSSASRVAAAVSIASPTSASEPDRNRRPKRPTVRTSTILMVATFSASLAAAAM